MQRPFTLLALVFAVSVSAAELNLDFREAKLNACPEGFRSTLSGIGSPGDWKIILDDAPSALPPMSEKALVTSKRLALAQLSRERTDERYPLLVYEGETFGDFKLTTQFKLVDGLEEQMAGIAFRIQDEKNYYYIRASGLGNSIYFLKWVNGQLSPPIGSKMEISRGVWHVLVIECRGNEIRCQLNGKEAFPALQDNSFINGKIGFWTKSDSVSHFADTRIVYTPREALAQKILQATLEKYARLVDLKIYAARNNEGMPVLLASKNPKEAGHPGSKVEQDVVSRGIPYHKKGQGVVEVTMPLRDCNGEIAAAVCITMKSFPGQTEKNAVERAFPIIKSMESRFERRADLFQ